MMKVCSGPDVQGIYQSCVFLSGMPGDVPTAHLEHVSQFPTYFLGVCRKWALTKRFKLEVWRSTKEHQHFPPL